MTTTPYDALLTLSDAELGAIFRRAVMAVQRFSLAPARVHIPPPKTPVIGEDLYGTIAELDATNIVAFTVKVMGERDPSAAGRAYTRILQKIGVYNFRQALCLFLGEIRQPGGEPRCRGSLFMSHYLKPRLADPEADPLSKPITLPPHAPQSDSFS